VIVRPLSRRLALLLLAPGCAVVLLLCLYPLFAAGWLSLHVHRPLLGTDYSHLTLANYRRLLEEPFYLSIFLRTLRISTTVTLLCLLIGYPIAYHLSQQPARVQGPLLLLYLSPWLISVVVKAYAWMLLLAPKGVIPELLVAAGITATSLEIMWTETAVVIGLVHVHLVFMIVPILTTLMAVDPNLIAAARNLGARWPQQFRRILLPLSLPGVVAGSTLVFTLSMSAFATPALLGGERVQVASYVAYAQSMLLANWPFGAAVAFGLLVLSGLAVYLYQAWYRFARAPLT
jgi:putative spermidine/putrescine transport system permease protein